MKVKVLRSDNGTEFMNSKCSELFASLGIIHQRSCAYTPQQNGVVERKHIHILNTARALRFHANIPISYWGHCVKAAIYLINKIPTAVLHGKSPYEMLYGTKPQLNHLKVFGCLCFVSLLPDLTSLLLEQRKESSWDMQKLKRDIGCWIWSLIHFMSAGMSHL